MTPTAIPVPAPSPPAPALPTGYTLRPGYPPIPAYLHLRAASGLSPKTTAQAAPIAHNSWHGCYVTFCPQAADDDNNDVNTPGPTHQEKPPTQREGVDVREDEEIVAMGRIIGDGGWYFHMADMAVLPQHQRRGLGDAVLKYLLGYIKAHAPADGDGAYVTLFADAPGRKLYVRDGFVETMPAGQMGMMLPMGWEKRFE